MKVIAKISGFIASASAVLVILACLAIALPIAFGNRPYTVLSGSMEPKIHTGAVVYVNTHDTIGEIGKIVAYRVNTSSGEDSYVIHRIVDEDNGKWVTKGDNNDVEDMNRLADENIIGSYAYSVPFLGYAFANRVIVIFAILLWIAGTTFISYALEKIAEDD